MFIHDVIQLEVPFEQVRGRLLEGEGRWLAPLAANAYRDGESTVVSLGVADEPVILSKNVTVVVDRPIDDGDVVAIPIRWQARDHASFFPFMDGHVEACPSGSTGTSLQLVGRYDPPGGRIGRLVDRVAMHRVAEAGARSFLRRVADGLVGANTRVAPWPLPGP